MSDKTANLEEGEKEIEKVEVASVRDESSIKKQSMKMDEFKFEGEKIKKPTSEGKGLMKELSFGHFLSSMVVILVLGLIFLGGLYYVVNKDFLFKGPKYQDPVTSAPISLYLEVGSPETDSLVTASTVVVSGKTIPDATVAIISQSQNQILSANELGEFFKVFGLDKGLNVIMVSSFDNKGNVKSENFNIYYGEEEKR